MPLEHGTKAGSPGFGRNIKAEEKAGKPKKQAIAIAFSEAKDESPHDIMDMAQRVVNLKRVARDYARRNQFDRANTVETEITELQSQMQAMTKGEDVKDLQPTDFEKLKSLLGEFFSEEEKEPEHKTADAAVGYKLEIDGFGGTFNSLPEIQAHVKSLKTRYPNLIGKTAKLWKGTLSPRGEYLTYSGAPTLIKVTKDCATDCACNDCKGTTDAAESYTVEFRENGKPKRSTFNNRQRAIDYFQSVKSDPNCDDASLYDDRNDKVMMHDAAPVRKGKNIHIHVHE